jgi:N-terminal acetyltransferase B complex non-catalytic subunit
LPTDRHPADDFAVLAAMSLLSIPKAREYDADELLATVRNTSTLQAVALLEYAASFSQSNFQIRLLLVRLYQYLGNGLMAMRAYDNLALKQIQLDTLSYIMFDRISSFHPHGFNQLGDSQFMAPREAIKKQQKMIRGAPGQIRRNRWLSYTHGSYNTVFELGEVMDRLECTLASVMSVTETMKIHRLIPPRERDNGGIDILCKSF